MIVAIPPESSASRYLLPPRDKRAFSDGMLSAMAVTLPRSTRSHGCRREALPIVEPVFNAPTLPHAEPVPNIIALAREVIGSARRLNTSR